VRQLAERHDLLLERARTLFDRYGTRARKVADYIAQGHDSPLRHHAGYSRREIEFLAACEMVVHLDDLLQRRTLVAIMGETTQPLLEELAEVVGQICGWSQEKHTAEIERTQQIFAAKFQPFPENT